MKRFFVAIMIAGLCASPVVAETNSTPFMRAAVTVSGAILGACLWSARVSAEESAYDQLIQCNKDLVELPPKIQAKIQDVESFAKNPNPYIWIRAKNELSLLKLQLENAQNCLPKSEEERNRVLDDAQIAYEKSISPWAHYARLLLFPAAFLLTGLSLAHQEPQDVQMKFAGLGGVFGSVVALCAFSSKH